MMSNNTLPLVTFEQAKKLRNAGFDWETTKYYALIDDFHFQWQAGKLCTGSCINNTPDVASAPTVALALKWMRDVKGCKSHIVWDEYGGFYSTHILELSLNDWIISVGYRTHEAAESALLDELLTLIENK